LDQWSRRYACWPIDHHLRPSKYFFVYVFSI